jgi:hypothetical protein
MHVRSLFRSAALVVVASSLFLLPAFAQAPLEPAQMPERTVFYLLWRGTPSADARHSNALLSLWDDPDFAPVRSGLVESLLSDSNKSADSKQPLTRDEIEQYSSLLENPFVLGYLAEPRGASSPTAQSSSAAPQHHWNGFFFVYNRSGKEALLSKAVLELRAAEKEPPKVSATSIAGIPVLKVERKTGVTYWAEHDKYVMSASEPEVFQEIVAILDGTAHSGGSLARTSAYLEAQPMLGSGILEFFVRVPHLKDLAAGANPADQRIQPVLEALKLEAVHSISGQLTLEGSKTRFTGAILGDAAPDTLFDLFEEDQASPASLAFVPPDAVSYQETQFSLLALYKTAKHAYQATLPEGQKGAVDFLEAMAQTRLGMPLPEALAMLTGEFASLQTSPIMDTTKQTYFIGIRNKPGTVKLLRSLLGERISSERNVGDTTYFKISLSGSQTGAGVMQWHFYHLAVTPDLILASSRREALEEEIARRASASTAAAVSLPPAFQTARAHYPEKLTGVSYFDFQKLDWQGLKDKWLAASAPAPASSFGQRAHARHAATPPPAWLLQLNPQVFPRHLHFSTSASWKDAKGIHFDGWLE